MNSKIVHDIENYLHQIISYSEYIMQKSEFEELFEYAKKIKNSAYGIDALINDTSASKQEINISQSTLGSGDLQYFVGKKVLIVDDMDENIHIMENIFKTFSCKIASAKNGEEAIEVFKNGFIPEFVCMDIIMPGVDGSQTVKELKALGCNAFYMAVSALKNQPNEVVSTFDYWMPKPFTAELMIEALTHYKSIWYLENKEKLPAFRLVINDEIKEKLIEYAKEGAYSSLESLIKTISDKQTKEFLYDLLKRMEFDSIIKFIVSS